MYWMKGAAKAANSSCGRWRALIMTMIGAPTVVSVYFGLS